MDKDLITRSGSLTESRRRFLEKSGASLVLATFGAAFFTSCSSTDDADPTGPPTPPGNSSSGITISGSVIVINLAIQTALNNSGNWLLIENAKALVANVNGSFVALTSVCTHSGCDRNWTFAASRFTCTCHGSVFDASGRVVQGPANQPLTQFTTQVSGTTLTITK
ncbi:MAG: Rieske (2Fe-2S) protein [Algoriphagus sp.]|uniref:QcrA and Rieske domain-containing protein n=1 Tax=Algoriphagus sp. TaxID=1872435 RepID=UPI002730A3C0|nr:Rieske (2Fe-2S) protein [Algoriphagus sp.]MDP2041021.1 Rieske (2Fe-2S) protein [Algoriphagus sp.]MDP3473656.1 Rieske (2Fe-2S) protein [Algoriphagus sp.]